MHLQAGCAALDLLGRLLEYDPSRRPTAAEALQHPFFHEVPPPPSTPAPSHISSFELLLNGGFSQMALRRAQ